MGGFEEFLELLVSEDGSGATVGGVALDFLDASEHVGVPAFVFVHPVGPGSYCFEVFVGGVGGEVVLLLECLDGSGDFDLVDFGIVFERGLVRLTRVVVFRQILGGVGFGRVVGVC